MTTEPEKDLAAILREEAELFDAEDDDDVATQVWVRPAPPRDPSQVYSVRIPVTELEKLRLVAEHKGVTPSALMRTWVLLRLDAEYEAMLGVCPRCGSPATNRHAKAIVEGFATAARKKATAAKGTAKKATAVRTVAKAAPQKNPAKRAAPRTAQ